jgi:hypothetical protein
LLVKRVLRLNVLLTIRWFRAHPLAPHLEASLGALPVIGLADRFGRRTLLLATVGIGLAQVTAAEQTASADRAKAVALVAAGYGTGAGAIAIAHSLAAGTLGFRGVFVLAVVPLALLPLLRRWIEEPDRFTVAAAGPEHPVPVLQQRREQAARAARQQRACRRGPLIA